MTGNKELHFLPLGGSGEIGMNLNLYAYGDQWLMVDCGISFADIYLPGIDLIMPDVSFIEEQREKLQGLIITHAHEDHVGAVAHLWPRLECPVYATPFTAKILRSKLSETSYGDEVEVIEVPLGGTVDLGSFNVEFVSLTHSIPEPNALNIKTPLGTIFHTGDWKLDPDPMVGQATNAEKLTAIGDEGVLAMVCDSTNVFSQAPSGSEKAVRDSLSEIISGLKGRIFCSTFASNVARVETLAKVAEEHGRNVCLIGRAMKRNVAVARECGYLKDFPNIIAEEDAGYFPDDEILFVMTGCQGESRAALMRITQGMNRNLAFKKTDTVIFSSKIIPGNELLIGRLHNLLVEQGVNVITEKDAFVHVSGHPGREELTEMYNWIRPEIAVPVHGELRHMTLQSELAQDLGIKKTIIPRNGMRIRLAPNGPEVTDHVPHGRLALDGRLIVHEDSDTIVTRRRMMYNGALVIHMVVDKAGGLVSTPSITILGLPEQAVGALEADIKEAIQMLLMSISKKVFRDDHLLAEEIRVTCRKAAKNFTGKQPGPVTKVNVTRLTELK